MAKVTYLGSSHFRELSKDDFSNLGVESKALAFPRGMIVEVEDPIAEVLITHEKLAGEFGRVSVEVESSDEPESEKAEKKPKDRARPNS